MKIQFFANIRDITKTKEAEVAAPKDILKLLYLVSEKYGKEMAAKLIGADGKLHPDMIVLLNGRHIEYVNGEESALTDADTVSFFPRIAGG